MRIREDVTTWRGSQLGHGRLERVSKRLQDGALTDVGGTTAGIGAEHAKWSPVATAWYRLEPEMVLLKVLLAPVPAPCLMFTCFVPFDSKATAD